MAHCIDPRISFDSALRVSHLCGNPVTPVTEILSMTGTPMLARGPAYTYTADGKLLKRTWARGAVTDYSYTTAGELALVDYADATPDVGYSYDRLGRQTQLTDGSGVRTFAYDSNVSVQVALIPQKTRSW